MAEGVQKSREQAAEYVTMRDVGDDCLAGIQFCDGGESASSNGHHLFYTYRRL